MTAYNVLLYRECKVGPPGLFKQALLPAEELLSHTEFFLMPVPLTACLLQQPEAALGRHLSSHHSASAGTTLQVFRLLWRICMS